MIASQDCSSGGRSSYCRRNFFIPLAKISIVISICPRRCQQQTFCSSTVFPFSYYLENWNIHLKKNVSFPLSLSLSHIHTQSLAMFLKQREKDRDFVVSMKQKRILLPTLLLRGRIHAFLVGIVKKNMLLIWCRRGLALESGRPGFKF